DSRSARRIPEPPDRGHASPVRFPLPRGPAGRGVAAAKVDCREGDHLDMPTHDEQITAARAAADRQIAHVNDAIDQVLIPDAMRLLAENDPADAWALLRMRVMDQLADRPQFMADLLAAFALRYASDVEV